jgi:tetrathionate reductase subunit B
MPRYAMVTDLRKCVACQACTAACNSEWDVPAGLARTRITKTPITGTFPHLAAGILVAQCAHCDEAPCITPCPSGATYRDANGIVQVNRELCIGCGFCVEACPYEARFINPAIKKVDKCDFCSPRLARGEEPVCVATCTAHAKFFGDLEDHQGDVFRMVYTGKAHRRETPQIEVGPNVYYLGKPSQVELVMNTFPPRPSRLPVAGNLWEKLAKPVVIGAVGLTFLGQAVAFFHQLWNGEKDHED